MKDIIVILSIFSLLLGATFATIIINTPDATPAHSVPAPSDVDFLEKLWSTCQASSTPGRKTLLLSQVERVSREHFNSRNEREAFALLLCIESKFNPSARSKAGAIGLAQIIPAYATEFLGQEVNAKDLEDAEVNLTVGAKRFKALLEKFEGNVALALSGYNSGADSPTTKGLKVLKVGHTETMGYISRFYTLQEQMK